MLTDNQKYALRHAASTGCDVNDIGDTVTIIGDHHDVMSVIDELRRTFGYNNVSWRTVRGSDSLIVTIDVDNTPDPHGEAGDRENRVNTPTNPKVHR